MSLPMGTCLQCVQDLKVIAARDQREPCRGGLLPMAGAPQARGSLCNLVHTPTDDHPPSATW